MRLVHFLFGRPLRSDEQDAERIGVVPAVPVLGLDALASASYGPGGGLTVLIPLGAVALGFMGPITAAISVVLLLVAISYGQTIPAYPNGGGSFTVAKENLGENAGLLAATALCIDYVLNTAVAISAGVGAVASVEPRLLPWTLPLCLGVLVALTIVNLRGVREAGLVFVAPTYLFVGCLLATVAIGAWKTFAAHGHPHPMAAPPQLSAAAEPAGGWVPARALASGCAARTGAGGGGQAGPRFFQPQGRDTRPAR